MISHWLTSILSLLSFPISNRNAHVTHVCERTHELNTPRPKRLKHPIIQYKWNTIPNTEFMYHWTSSTFNKTDCLARKQRFRCILCCWLYTLFCCVVYTNGWMRQRFSFYRFIYIHRRPGASRNRRLYIYVLWFRKERIITWNHSFGFGS